MRHLLRLTILAGLVWSAYWYGAGWVLRGSVDRWFAAQEARGWQAEHTGISTSGYPARHVTLLNGPALADPSTGAAWQADWLILDNPAIWPGHLTLQFPRTAQRLSYFDRTAVIEARDMRADLNLQPGTDLVFERLELAARQWTVTQDGDTVMAAGAANLSMLETEQPETYRISLTADQFAPGDMFRGVATSAAELPQAFDTLDLQARVRFDRRWDRSALEQRRPQPVEIDLKLAEARWGALHLFATGAVTVDKEGIPEGEIALKAENWRQMLAMAEEVGALPPPAVDPAERVLSMLAGLGGKPDAINVRLSFRNGSMALGPFPLGPAPRLILR